jgi:hypothetical protein
MTAYRMVETQHVAATMRLVDSGAEQDLLEQMLETSKPPLPLEFVGVHYLLAAPFRYLPPTGSRFRSPGAPGIWYGADDPYGACAEVSYWRQRFLLDCVGLMKEPLTSEHSLYRAEVAGLAIDLLAHPWAQAEAQWKHPADYNETQRLGKLARESGAVQWIRYGSVRAEGHTCAAVLSPQCLSMAQPEGSYEQWHCYTTHNRVTLSNGRVRYDF